MSDCFLARFEFPTGCHFSSCPDSIFLELAGLDFLSTFSCYEGSLDVSIVAWICYLFSSFWRPYWNSSAVLSSCLNESVDSRQNLEIPRIVSILERNNHQHVSVLFESQLVQVLRQWFNSWIQVMVGILFSRVSLGFLRFLRFPRISWNCDKFGFLVVLSYSVGCLQWLQKTLSRFMKFFPWFSTDSFVIVPRFFLSRNF